MDIEEVSLRALILMGVLFMVILLSLFVYVSYKVVVNIDYSVNKCEVSDV